jgi:hypothetical protein
MKIQEKNNTTIKITGSTYQNSLEEINTDVNKEHLYIIREIQIICYKMGYILKEITIEKQ